MNSNPMWYHRLSVVDVILSLSLNTKLICLRLFAVLFMNPLRDSDGTDSNWNPIRSITLLRGRANKTMVTAPRTEQWLLLQGQAAGSYPAGYISYISTETLETCHQIQVVWCPGDCWRVASGGEEQIWGMGPGTCGFMIMTNLKWYNDTWSWICQVCSWFLSEAINLDFLRNTTQHSITVLGLKRVQWTSTSPICCFLHLPPPLALHNWIHWVESESVSKKEFLDMTRIV